MWELQNAVANRNVRLGVFMMGVALFTYLLLDAAVPSPEDHDSPSLATAAGVDHEQLNSVIHESSSASHRHTEHEHQHHDDHFHPNQHQQHHQDDHDHHHHQQQLQPDDQSHSSSAADSVPSTAESNGEGSGSSSSSTSQSSSSSSSSATTGDHPPAESPVGDDASSNAAAAVGGDDQPPPPQDDGGGGSNPPPRLHAKGEYAGSGEVEKETGTGLIKQALDPTLYSWVRVDQAKKAASLMYQYAFYDRVAALQPLCMRGKSKNLELQMAEGRRVCSAFNTSQDWLDQNCEQLQKNVLSSELNLPMVPEIMGELKEADPENYTARWVPGTTVLQVLDRSCGNIAHFMGRILMLNHLLVNRKSYGVPEVDQVIVVTGSDLMKRFVDSAKWGTYHEGVLGSIVYPSKPVVDVKLDDVRQQVIKFQNERRKGSNSAEPRPVFLVEQLGTLGGDAPPLCFERVLVPGYMKGRFFIDDAEYPSALSSLRGRSADDPKVARDGLRFRSQIGSYLFRQAAPVLIKPKVLYLDRGAQGGSRRLITPESRLRLLEILSKETVDRGYELEVVRFENKTFKEQVKLMRDAALVVGVHGANLVNCIFMPPLSAMLELFPFRFYHPMYVEAGRGGVKYYSMQVSTGQEYENWANMDSMQACMSEHACKIHYRDAMLEFNDADIQTFTARIHDAFHHLSRFVSNAKPFTAEDAAAPNRPSSASLNSNFGTGFGGSRGGAASQASAGTAAGSDAGGGGSGGSGEE